MFHFSCYCGRIRENHLPVALQQREEPLTGSWDPEQDVAEYPTDAHGEIIFINEGESNSEPAKVSWKGNQLHDIIYIQLLLK